MCRHYVFVASAGAYKASNIEPMHVEGDERKASAGVTPVFRALCERLAKQHLSSKHCSCIVQTAYAVDTFNCTPFKKTLSRVVLSESSDASSLAHVAPVLT
jgi:hypothetical protein